MQDKKPIERLLEIMRRLRAPGGCPWDREQTVASLKKYLIEESYEVLDAIDSGDPEKHKEELGDVLLQVVFHAAIREEEGAFTFDDVAEGLCRKLVRRHPHVFGNTSVSGSAEVLKNWQALKAEERPGHASALKGVPRHLPALHKAHKVQAEASRVGFDWTRVHDVVAKIDEELAEVKEVLAAGDAARLKEELGDLLFAVVNLSRFMDISAEEALDATVAKFVRRFEQVEQRVRESGRKMADCTLAELDAHWERIKEEERATAASRSSPGRAAGSTG